MFKGNSKKSLQPDFMKKHPIIANVAIIVVVAVLGVVIVHLALTVFTKHGRKSEVPNVVGISYTQAIEKLHDAGFKIEIRDSLYLDNVKPGYVVEQYPDALSTVKPGRKVFLYINAVYPKQVVIDPSSGNSSNIALEGYSERQAVAQLEELGFRKIGITYVSGTSDRVKRILANSKTVRVGEKVAVNVAIIVEVYDGSRQHALDSTMNRVYWQDQQTKALEDSVTKAINEELEPQLPPPSEPDPTENEMYEEELE